MLSDIIKPLNKKALVFFAFGGSAIGLILISIFLSGTGESDPSWGAYWMWRPLIIVPMGTFCGGAAFNLLSQIGSQKHWRITLSVMGIFIYIISLWLSFVLGLDGTYWH